MSIVSGTPDWQRGTSSIGALLASVPGATLTKSVTIPTNALSLWLAFSTPVLPDTIEVLGNQSGCPYPGTFHQGDPRTLNGYFFVFNVSSQLDSSVTVTLTTSAGLGTWYLYASTGISAVDVPQFGLITQTIGQPTNLQGVLILGSDGTDGRALKTDATGQLYIANPGGGATPQPVGGALVSEGILAMGSDGTDGRALSTDVNGRQIPLVPTASAQVAPPLGISTMLLAAPSSGANYLFGIYVAATSVTGIMTISFPFTNPFAVMSCYNSLGQSIDLHGMRVTQQVNVNAASGYPWFTILYAPGP